MFRVSISALWQKPIYAPFSCLGFGIRTGVGEYFRQTIKGLKDSLKTMK